MTQLLDLYITHWTEPWEIGKKGFDMLALQRGVDWSQIRITLVHDGSPEYPAEYFAGYPYRIRQVSLEHGGIAKARNWCIDDSRADWIRWHDFDDMLAGVYSLRNLMGPLRDRPNYELLWFDVYAEAQDGRIFIKDERDPVVIHGKMFNRAFLLDHGIRFPEHLTWCEDSAMLAVVEMEVDHSRIGKVRCEAPIYAWICRDGSLCNRPEIRYQNLQSFFRRHCYVQEEFRKRGHMNEYYIMSARVLTDAYYTLERAGLTEDTSGHRQTILEYYREHRTDLLRISNGVLNDVIGATNRENPGCEITRDEFLAWLKGLKEEAGKNV